MTAAPPTAAGTDPPPTSARRSRSGLRALVLRMHFYAGVLIAPFLFVAAFSGMLYAASVPAEKAIYADVLRVPVGEEQVSIEEQVAAAAAERPEGTVQAVRPGTEPGDTTRVLLHEDGLGPSHQMAVFVDPYTAEVQGVHEAYGSSSALPVRYWIDELHRSMHLGDVGRLYSELAASWMGVVALGGVVLWIARRRGREKRLRRTLLPQRGVGGRRGTMSWHGAVGLWIAVGLGFLAATGLTWSQYAGSNVTDMRASLSWQTPTVQTGPGGTQGTGGGDHADHGDHGDHGEHGGHGDEADESEHGDHGEHAGHGDHGDTGEVLPEHGVGADIALLAARGEGIRDPVEIVFPTEPGGSYQVKEIKAQWPNQHDAVAVDQDTAVVVDTVRFEDWPLAAKLARWGVDGHMGLLFGLPNQIALIGLTGALMAVIVLGYRMWWQRRPRRGGVLAWGRPPQRGAWRKVPLPDLIPLALLTVAVGYFLPLLGISLLVFLAIDALLGFLARRRREGVDPGDGAAPAESGDGPPTPPERGDDRDRDGEGRDERDGDGEGRDERDGERGSTGAESAPARHGPPRSDTAG